MDVAATARRQELCAATPLSTEAARLWRRWQAAAGGSGGGDEALTEEELLTEELLTGEEPSAHGLSFAQFADVHTSLWRYAEGAAAFAPLEAWDAAVSDWRAEAAGQQVAPPAAQARLPWAAFVNLLFAVADAHLAELNPGSSFNATLPHTTLPQATLPQTALPHATLLRNAAA